MNRPIITLLTDFGLSDHYVGAMKGVILSICPDAQLVDITHEIRPYSILEAAFTLSQAWRYFPQGTTHLVVVDPGVGSSRRPLVAEADGHRFVAPDNGVLTMIGPFTAREIRESGFFRASVSQTFHGRDIFAPVAAHLATGISPQDFGPAINDPLHLAGLEPVLTGPGEWTGIVLRIDRYGNVVTNLSSLRFLQSAEETPKLRFSARFVNQYYPTYTAAPPGELFVVGGSSGYIEVSMNQGDAASELAVCPGTPVTLLI